MPVRKELSLFLLIMVLAAGLRLAGMTFDSLWLDESYQTMASASGRIPPVFQEIPASAFTFQFGTPADLSEAMRNFRIVDPLCPPLYQIILNRWMHLFGSGDLAVRLPSALLSLLAIALLYLIGRSAVSSQAAILACLFMAVSPFDIYYAQEARMYSLVVLASVASSGAMLLSMKLSAGRGLTGKLALTLGAYSLSTWALINSHYTGLFVVAFQVLFILACTIRHRSFKLIGAFSLSWVLVLLIWLPWLDLFRQAAAIRTESFYVARQPTWWWPAWALAIRIPINWIEFLAGKRVALYAIPLYLTSAALIVSALFPPKSLSDKGKDKSTGSNLGFFWSWAMVPSLVLLAIDIFENHKVIEIPRYLIGTAPAIYMLCGAGTAWLTGRHGFTYVLIAVHSAFALINNSYAHLVPQREPWRQMAQLAEMHVGRDDLLVVSQPYNIVCLDRYLSRPLRQVGASPAQGRQHLENLLACCDRFWLITAQEGEGMVTMIPPRFQVASRIDLPRGLHLRLFTSRDR